MFFKFLINEIELLMSESSHTYVKKITNICIYQ